MKTVSYQQIDFDDRAEQLPESENIPLKTQGEEIGIEAEKAADGAACDGDEGENMKDAPENEKVPVFEQVGWKAKVQNFLQSYPIAKNFSAQIGRAIADSEVLSQDENCLEKAFLPILANAYISPEQLASDEEFLQKYIFGNQVLKDRIIQEYLDALQQNLPPKSISARGQITLTPPSRPTSIAEAGNVFKAMFNNRRI